MSKFLSELEVKFVGDHEIELLADLLYCESLNKNLKVPKGFVCDGASIPRIAWSIVGYPMEGDYVEAAVIHDYLYRNAIGTKVHADNVFLQAMKDLKVNIVKRRVMYWAVKYFGKGAWR